MKPSLSKKSFSITISLLLISFISKTEEQLPVLTLSGQEKDIVVNNLGTTYVYLGNELSDISQAVRQVSNFYASDKAKRVCQLRDHVDSGYKIGPRDEVIEILMEALIALDDDVNSNKLVRRLEDNIKKLQNNKLNIEIGTEQNVRLQDEQAKENDTIDIQLQVQGMPIVIEGEEVTRDPVIEKIEGCLEVTNDALIGRNLTVKNDLLVKDDATVRGDLVVKNELEVGDKAKFKKDTEFKKDVEIEGDLVVCGDSKFKGDVVDLACDLDVGCNILLLDSDPLGGNIIKDGVSFIHNCGISNTFVGKEAGNLELTGTHSAGFGASALQNNTTGLCNTAVGAETLKLNTVGTGNAGLGIFTLLSNKTGDYNAAIGLNALKENVSGSFNVAVGRQALFKSTGNKNIAIGDCAGEALTLGDNNIYFGNFGLEAEFDTIRIGAAQEACFVQGVFNATLSDGCAPVFVNSLGQLGTVIIARKFKNNIINMDTISDGLMDLHPVKFTYKGDSNDNLHYGLITEEVEEIFPELVARDKDGNSYAVRYHELPVMLLNELQKSNTNIENNSLKGENNSAAIQKNSSQIAKLYEVIKTLSNRDRDNNAIIQELRGIINDLLARIATLEKSP